MKSKCVNCKSVLYDFEAYTCKCNDTHKFCSICRFPFNHKCTIDALKTNIENLTKTIYKIEPRKLELI